MANLRKTKRNVNGKGSGKRIGTSQLPKYSVFSKVQWTRCILFLLLPSLCFHSWRNEFRKEKTLAYMRSCSPTPPFYRWDH